MMNNAGKDGHRGGGALKGRPTEAFDELHEAHDVVDGSAGKHLDVVGADKGLEDVKDRSLRLSCVGGGRAEGWVRGRG